MSVLWNRSLLLGFTAIAALAGCGPELEDASSPDELGSQGQETICGRTDESAWINDYNGSLGQSVAFVKAHANPVGAMERTAGGRKYCSGTLIANDLFLTAGHCVDGTTVGQFVAFNFERAAGSAQLEEQEHFRITQVVEDGLGGLDYAILRLANSPGTTFGVAEVKITDPAIGELITLIGHPAGKPKMVEVGHVGRLSGNFFRYSDLDTLGGNSGSGVLDSQGAVVGVHTLGGCSATGGANSAVRLSRIAQVSTVL